MNRSESFLPDFCSLDTTLVLVMSSLMLGLVLTLADFASGHNFLADFGLRSFFIIWIVLLSGGILCLSKNRLRRLDPALGGLVTFAVIQFGTLLVTVTALWGLNRIGYRLGEGHSHLEFTLRVVMVSSLATAVWLRYQFMQARWRQQSRAEAVARLDALQTRMRPHFLFNGLNSIAAIMREDPATAEELLLDLAEVFRAILKQDTQLVPLSDEIGLTRQYLRLEQLRLGGRLQVEWNIAHAPANALVPPLSLQPLVENAIRHGVERADQGGRVVIDGRLSRRGLVLSVSNTLPEAVANGLDRRGSGQALANLRARLEVCFQDQARLYTSLTDGYYKVRMIIPYRRGVRENSDR